MISFNVGRELRKRRRLSIRKTRREQTCLINSSSSADDNNDDNDEHGENHEHDENDENAYRADLISDDLAAQTVFIDASPAVVDYVNDDFDKNDYHLSDSSSNDDDVPLFRGGRVSVRAAVRRLVTFFVDFNMDKKASTNLLRLLKTLLPQPNKLPRNWNRIMKIHGHVSKSISTFLCGQCHHE